MKLLERRLFSSRVNENLAALKLLNRTDFSETAFGQIYSDNLKTKTDGMHDKLDWIYNETFEKVDSLNRELDNAMNILRSKKSKVRHFYERKIEQKLFVLLDTKNNSNNCKGILHQVFKSLKKALRKANDCVDDRMEDTAKYATKLINDTVELNNEITDIKKFILDTCTNIFDNDTNNKKASQCSLNLEKIGVLVLNAVSKAEVSIDNDDRNSDWGRVLSAQLEACACYERFVYPQMTTSINKAESELLTCTTSPE